MKLVLPGSIFLAAFFLPYLLAQIPSLPDRVVYATDLIVALVGSVVVARLIASKRFGMIPARYWLTFLAFCYVAVSAILINDVSPDVIFAGVRTYFKYVPLFLLPFAYEYSETDLKRVLMLVLALALVQVPVTLHQRFFEFSAFSSGDSVVGTLAIPAAGSVLSLTALTMMVAFFLAGRLSIQKAVPLCLLVFIPAMINETKITPIFMLISGAALVFLNRNRLSLRQIGLVLSLGVTMLASFVLVYNQLYGDRTGGGYLSYMTSKERTLDNYNLTGIQAKKFEVTRRRNELVASPYREGIDLPEDDTSEPKVGRLDSVRLPFQALLPDEGIRLLLGLGIGNVTSTFGNGGDYLYIKRELAGGETDVALLVWETGVLGLILVISLVVLFINDSLFLAKEESLVGAVAVGSFGIFSVWICCTFYKSLFNAMPQILALFMFLGGVLAAARVARTMSIAAVPTSPKQLEPS